MINCSAFKTYTIMWSSILCFASMCLQLLNCYKIIIFVEKNIVESSNCLCRESSLSNFMILVSKTWFSYLSLACISTPLLLNMLNRKSRVNICPQKCHFGSCLQYGRIEAFLIHYRHSSKWYAYVIVIITTFT